MDNFIPSFQFCVFDFETTGLNPKNGDEIIEIGAFRISDCEIKDKFHSFVQSKGEVPPEILDLTGVTNSDLQNSQPIDSVINKFLDFIGTRCLVAHNLSFDRTFLNFYSPQDVINPGIDTLKMSRQYGCFESNKLEDVAKDLNIDMSDTHRALHDAEATAKIFLQLSFMMYWEDLIDGTWFYKKNKQSNGPCTTKQLLNFDEFTSDTLVCRVGDNYWQPASNFNPFQNISEKTKKTNTTHVKESTTKNDYHKEASDAEHQNT
ncbi:MAG: exonuclease domain-containing protein, partial [Flavobacteriales bacterium]